MPIAYHVHGWSRVIHPEDCKSSNRSDGLWFSRREYAEEYGRQHLRYHEIDAKAFGEYPPDVDYLIREGYYVPSERTRAMAGDEGAYDSTAGLQPDTDATNQAQAR